MHLHFQMPLVQRVFLSHIHVSNFRVTLVVQRNELLNRNDLWKARSEYLNQTMLSILERPLLGVGPGNFVYASKKYTKPTESWTETAHNIFLEIFVENGIPAGIVFVLIMFQIFRQSERSLFFYLALSMLINFQFDYTYRIYSFLLLFFTLLGVSYKEVKDR